MRNILLFSAGVDSFIGYYYLRENYDVPNLTLIYSYNDKIPYAATELKYVLKFRDELMDKSADMRIISYPQYYSNIPCSDSFIPARNLIFALCTCFKLYNDYATAYLQSDGINIYLGGLRDDRIGDNSPEFCKHASKLLSASFDEQVTVKSVFDYKLSKFEIVGWFVKNHPLLAQHLVTHTFSCYSPINNDHCYSCRACFRRNVSLQNIELLPFHDKQKLNDWIIEMKEHKDTYDPVRYEATLNYIEALKQQEGEL